MKLDVARGLAPFLAFVLSACASTPEGPVVPIGFDPAPFCVTKIVPLPRIPRVSFDGASGNPLDGAFTVRLRVLNANAFPMAFHSVESCSKLNGRRYDLLRPECSDQIAPGGTRNITLGMQQTRGKGLSVGMGNPSA